MARRQHRQRQRRSAAHLHGDNTANNYRFDNGSAPTPPTPTTIDRRHGDTTANTRRCYNGSATSPPLPHHGMYHHDVSTYTASDNTHGPASTDGQSPERCGLRETPARHAAPLVTHTVQLVTRAVRQPATRAVRTARNTRSPGSSVSHLYGAVSHPKGAGCARPSMVDTEASTGFDTRGRRSD